MNNIQFLPSDYEAPKSSSYYMKIREGENKIRILSQPIFGWEDWTADKKPVRFTYDNKPLKPIDPKKPVKHFWAFIIWNYNEQRIQILQVTQATIRNSIEALCKDKDWGVPFFYDIKIIKSGEGTDTEYVVNPLPHKPVHSEIIKAFDNQPCNLEALFTNSDPFSLEWETFTQGVFSECQVHEVEKATEAFMGKEQAEELEKALEECTTEYQQNFWDFILKQFPKAETLENLPMSMYERLKKSISKKREENLKANKKENSKNKNLPWEKLANA